MTSLFYPWSRAGAAALAAFIALDASPASACSCAEPLEPGIALAGADVVFEGTPRDAVALEADLGVDGYSGARRFDFEVSRYFKGQLGPDVSVFTIDQSSACGRNYPLDEPHIIYARYSESGLLTDYACSRSRPSGLASDDGSVLGAGVAPDPAVASRDDDVENAGDPEFASGIHHNPLDAEPAGRGCASSLALRPASGAASRSWPPGERPWLIAVAGIAAAAWRLRRRAR
jgi:hypothetical protein